ncbi:MAG: SDR family NAD(P)-dependent oxidoreductase [Acidimicrobiales bacterium]
MKDALGSVQSVLVLGGGSDIAAATVRRLVGEGARTVVLAARDAGNRLTGLAGELRSIGASTVDLVDFEADDTSSHRGLLEDIGARHGDLDLVLIAFGELGDPAVTREDPGAALALLRTNVLGTVSTVMESAAHLRRQGHGTIVVLSSVAAERVRASNFPYGASKAAVDGFCQGLADHLEGSGVGILLVRPGFVRTKMTAGLRPAPFATTPEVVAEAVVEGLRRGAPVVWAPPRLRLVMSILRHLPRPLFRRLDR